MGWGRFSAGPEPGGGVYCQRTVLQCDTPHSAIMLPGYCDFRAVYIQQTASSSSAVLSL